MGVFSSCFVVQTEGYRSGLVLFVVHLLWNMAHLGGAELHRRVSFHLKERILKLWKEAGSGGITLP